MKNINKTLIAMMTAVVLVLGSGALFGGATAAYPNTVRTSTDITRSSSVTEGRTFSVSARVKAGNANVNGGRVKFSFGGRTATATVKNGKASVRLKAPSVSRTKKKTLNAYFTPASNSSFKKSSDSVRITVKNK